MPLAAAPKPSAREGAAKAPPARGEAPTHAAEGAVYDAASAWGPLSLRIARKCGPCASGGASCPACAEEDEAKLQRKCASCEDGPIQMKGVEVSQPGDPDEVEADRVAERVLAMRMPEDGAAVSSRETPRISRMADGDADAPRPEIVSSLGAGSPLPQSTRSYFEPRFGASFDGVRVHDGGAAHAAAGQVNARAFTVGRDVVFSRGAFQPESASGRSLLAHELTHVVQQGGGARLSRDGDELEDD